MGKVFDFEGFDSDITRMLKENEEVMARVIPIRRPGEIGAVAVHLTEDDLPPEAA